MSPKDHLYWMLTVGQQLGLKAFRPKSGAVWPCPSNTVGWALVAWKGLHRNGSTAECCHGATAASWRSHLLTFVTINDNIVLFASSESCERSYHSHKHEKVRNRHKQQLSGSCSLEEQWQQRPITWFMGGISQTLPIQSVKRDPREEGSDSATLRVTRGFYQSSAEVSSCPVWACPVAHLISRLLQEAKADLVA